MKAIEIKAKTDKAGRIKIDHNLGVSGWNVRILILLEDEISESEEESQWLNSVRKNSAFDFLNEPEEDIYSLKDGKPLHD